MCMTQLRSFQKDNSEHPRAAAHLGHLPRNRIDDIVRAGLPRPDDIASTHILHLGEKPGFLRMTNGQTLNLWLRNPVF